MSNAPDAIRASFDDEAKETNYSSSDEDENNEEVDGYKNEKSRSNMEEDEEDTQNARKRKCKSST